MPRQLKMSTISREEFDQLRRSLPRVTKEGVMDTYRISQNSWYKLRDGVPVKQCVIDRMRARYAAVKSDGQPGQMARI